MIVNRGFYSDVFLKFLSGLVQESTRKVFLIVDHHPD